MRVGSLCSAQGSRAAFAFVFAVVARAHLLHGIVASGACAFDALILARSPSCAMQSKLAIADGLASRQTLAPALRSSHLNERVVGIIIVIALNSMVAIVREVFLLRLLRIGGALVHGDEELVTF